MRLKYPPHMLRSRYFLAEIDSHPEPIPEGQRVPFEWDCSPIGRDGSATLAWKNNSAGRSQSRLRLTVGIDVRETKRIAVVSGHSKKVLGEFDIRYAPVFQTFEIFLGETQTALAIEEGVILQMTEGSQSLWVFNGKSKGSSVPEVLTPHLLMEESEVVLPSKPFDPFLEQMASLASVQPFGWMEGCVLDGLLDLEECFPHQGFRESAKAHLDLFVKKSGALIYEGPRSEPLDGRLASIEETLMAAFIVRFFPGHPSIQIVKDFWASARTADGAILDHGLLSAEGSYTIGYPLAVLANAEKSEELALWALAQVRARQKGLVVGETIHLRLHADGTRSFPNWSRGIAWYFLGLVRTLGVLGKRDDVSDLLAECRRLAAWLLPKRNSENLWNCFIDDNETRTDSSGSAGIAAALALGSKLNFFGQSEMEAARLAVKSIQKYLTPDGLLGGVAQSNRGGTLLQRSNYRVISAMGMGLLAQAIAATK